MKLFLSIPFLLSFYFSYAQDSGSKVLQKYKYRTPGYSAIALGGTINENLGTIFSNSNAHNFNINSGVIGFKTISTDRYLINTNFNVNFSLNSFGNHTVGIPSKSSNFFVNSSIGNDTKKYNCMNFVEFGYSASASANRYSFSDNVASSNPSIQRNSLDSFSVVLGIGRGRLENVTDAQMAFNILQDLNKNNLLNKNFTENDLLSLSKTITNVNNRRIFDFRNKHKFELQQIDSCLQQLGLIKENSIEYFSTLIDNWFYNFNPIRNTGKIIYIKLQPKLLRIQNYSKFKLLQVDSVNKNIQSSIGSAIVIGIEKDNAINMKWQFNKGIQLVNSFFGNMQNYNSNTSNYVNFESSLIGFLDWGYFPNTRTNLTLSIQNILAYSNLLNNFNKYLNNNTSVSFNANYFVNNKTRVTADLGVYFQSLDINQPHPISSVQQNFNVGIQHYFR